MKVLAVVAHPDDEVIGVGGTLARHAARGDEVTVVILAEGKSSRKPRYEPLAEDVRRAAHAETEEAGRVLGLAALRRHDLPDNRLDSIDLLDLVKLVAGHVGEVAPEVVYTHHGGDLSIDHQRVHRAVMTATRPLPGCPVKWVFAFETASSTEWSFREGDAFQANYFVDIGAHLERKMAAMAAYRSELHEPPHPRSLAAIERNARTWGSRCGLAAAEAFRVVRGLW